MEDVSEADADEIEAGEDEADGANPAPEAILPTVPLPLLRMMAPAAQPERQMARAPGAADVASVAPKGHAVAEAQIDAPLEPAQGGSPAISGNPTPEAVPAESQTAPHARPAADPAGTEALPVLLQSVSADGAASIMPGPPQLALPPAAAAQSTAPVDGAPLPQAPAASTPLSMVPIEIGMRALDGVRRFEIRLHPEEYGRVDVTLDLDGEGGVKAHLAVEHRETLSLLQRDVRSLERSFEQAGLRLDQGALQFSWNQSSGNGQRGALRQDGRTEQISDAKAPQLEAVLRSIRAPTGAVDIRI